MTDGLTYPTRWSCSSDPRGGVGEHRSVRLGHETTQKRDSLASGVRRRPRGGSPGVGPAELYQHQTPVLLNRRDVVLAATHVEPRAGLIEEDVVEAAQPFELSPGR